MLTESILGFVVGQAIYVAAVLGIADLLVEGPQSASRLTVMGRCCVALTEGGLKP